MNEERRGSYIVEKISHVEDEPAEAGYERARSESWGNSYICLDLLWMTNSWIKLEGLCCG